MLVNRLGLFRPVPVLPTVYGDALSYSEQIGKIGAKCNEIITALNELAESIPVLADDFIATPEQYGAVGDGVTDDTVALQNCLNGEKNIIVLTQTYNITTVAIPSDKVIVGLNGSTVKASSAITISEASNTIIKGVHFVTTGLYQTCVVNMYHATNFIIENCEFEGVYGGDIVSVGLLNVVYSENCIFKNLDLHDSNSEGLIINNCKHCSVLGGRFYHNRRGSGVHVGTNDYSDVYGWNIIDGVECWDNTGANIGLSGYKNVCTNSYVHDNNDTTWAIVLGHENSGGKECIVSNCVIINNNNGIYTYEAENTIIANNVIDGKEKENPISPNLNYGVVCSANSYDITVANNVIKGCDIGIQGATIIANNNIGDCTNAIKANVNTDIKSYVYGDYIEDCDYGITDAKEVKNCHIVTDGTSIYGQGTFVGNDIKSGAIAIYETSNSDVSFITNNVIDAVTRAIYSNKTGVFEYNMLKGVNVVSAPNMTAENNYDFT